MTVKDIYKWRSADSPQTFSGLFLRLDGGRAQKGPEKGETQEEGTLRQDLIPGQSGIGWGAVNKLTISKSKHKIAGLDVSSMTETF